jgi:hypothetical protein
MLAIATSSVHARGRNWNGALVVHVDDTIVYSSGDDYCQTPDLPSLCQYLNANGSEGLVREQFIWLLAAFLPERDPGVTTIQFGIAHNLPANQGYFTQFAACGPSPLELPDTGWPETGLGNLVAYGSPVYDNIFRFYWFAVFRDGPDNFFGTRTYPSTNEAKFVDDGNPPYEDLIFNFGTVRWDGTGFNQCPEHVDPGGACCYCDGTCLIQWESECQGEFLGMDVPCDPNPCPASIGACCYPDGHCEISICAECPGQDGVWQGPGTTCDPNPCPPLPEACCFLNGSCTYVPAEQCAADGGAAQGHGTDCDPNPCEIHETGACCLDDQGTCVIVVEEECVYQGGGYMGDGVPCEPNPCISDPIEKTTWGRIKATYR